MEVGRDPTGSTPIATAGSRVPLLMEAARPVASPERDAFLNDIAAELGQHEVIGPGLLHRIISEVQRRYDIADQRRSTGVIPLNEAAGIEAMPLSPEQEVLCERAEKGEPVPRAAALIRQQAYQIDDLWDRLSRAYALVRRESPAEMIQEEMEALQAMLEERRRSSAVAHSNKYHSNG
jgi:hypothetical protein